MAPPFRRLREDGLTPAEVRQKHIIESDFDLLEHFYFSESASPKRLKHNAQAAITTPAAVRSLGIVFALRTLELAEGMALLIEGRNYIASLPIARSVYEILFAVLYVQARFKDFVEADNPDGFADTARRLLVGKSASESGVYPVPVKRLKPKALEYLRGVEQGELTSDPDDVQPEQMASHLDKMYSELSDATHPTQWSMAFYTHERSDGLGLDWSRKPDQQPLLYPLVHLALPLGLIRRFIVNLPRLAERVEANEGTP